MIIVPGHRSDIISLMRVELNAFPTDQYDFYTIQALIENSLVFLKMVNPIDMSLVGFSICSNMMGEEHARHTRAAELVSLAIHPNFHHQGYGKRLLERTLIELQHKGVELISLQVKVSNEPAIALYQKFKFRTVETLPQYYDDSKEDAYHMVWKKQWKSPSK